ncbi:MAG: hypothetical protein H8D22_02925 [Candidatus Cloacimonetes bacterium]|nr:hypothetical protein [Candidatus Cloacimonadota bacterium]
MKKIFRIILEIIMWVVIILAFAALGLGSDNPSISTLIWAIVAIIIFAVGFIIAKKTRRRTVTTHAQILIRRIIGIILVLFACFLPCQVFSKFGFPLSQLVLIFIFAFILVAIGVFAIFLINKGAFNSFLGYIILIVAAFLPALAMSGYDLSYSALGTVYYLTVALAIFSWIGISMFTAKKIR